MITLQIIDLENLYQPNEEDLSLIIGGTCYHNGQTHEVGTSIVVDGAVFICKEKKNGSTVWKRKISFSDVLSVIGDAISPL